jgi:phosphonatase-like hydrolase
MGQPVIRLAVLDMAGTTVRDDGTVEASFLDALESIGIGRDADRVPDDLSYVRATMGSSKIEVFRHLLGEEPTAQAANEAFESAFARRVDAGEIEPIDGAAATLDEMRDAGIAVCLTTGFSDATREAILDRLGWRDRVDLSLSPGPGIRGRPHPDLALTALMRLGIDDVAQLATAGDTTSDLLAGRRAGASVVAGVLTGAHDRATLETAPHTHILGSIRELPAIIHG